MTEFEGCYVFTLEEANTVSQRPGKRRKIDPAKVPAEQNAELLFAPLLKGMENIESTRTRFELFESSWRPKENSLKRIHDNASSETVKEVASFLKRANHAESNGKLRTGLIMTGPDSSTTLFLFESIADVVNRESRTVLVTLSSAQSPNLKTALNYINQRATSQNLDSDDNTLFNESRDGRRLNYDLQILNDYVQSHSISQVLLSFQDSEAFEAKALTDLIQVLSSWSDRIPFVLLFGVGTSVELLQEKLSREIIRALDGSVFDLQHVDVDDVFRACQSEETSLWIGSGLSRIMLQRQKDYIQSHSTFINSLKYAYMTHFFANPLSIFLNTSTRLHSVQMEHFEAVRSLPSFRRYAQTLIERKEYETLRTLLDDDSTLGDLIVQELQTGKEAMQAMIRAVDVLFRIQSSLNLKSKSPWSEMYIQAMCVELAGSAAFDEIMVSIRRLPSDNMEALLEALAVMSVPSELVKIMTELDQLTDHLEDPKVPLRSAYDVHHGTLRTTVVAQKVSLSKNTATLSAQDSAYTKIVDRIYAILCSYFESTLVNPQDLFLNEIFIFDSKSPHREVFTPKPRYAIERALSSPHDYLGCDCCGGSEGGLSATQPASAILYQLYLESGGVINTADLWSAFWTIVGEDGVEDEEAEQQRALALFSRALAELKYLGMIKNSRKKADHLAKVTWKGL